jgi:hypothetical protein
MCALEVRLAIITLYEATAPSKHTTFIRLLFCYYSIVSIRRKTLSICPRMKLLLPKMTALVQNLLSASVQQTQRHEAHTFCYQRLQADAACMCTPGSMSYLRHLSPYNTYAVHLQWFGFRCMHSRFLIRMQDDHSLRLSHRHQMIRICPLQRFLRPQVSPASLK